MKDMLWGFGGALIFLGVPTLLCYLFQPSEETMQVIVKTFMFSPVLGVIWLFGRYS